MAEPAGAFRVVPRPARTTGPRSRRSSRSGRSSSTTTSPRTAPRARPRARCTADGPLAARRRRGACRTTARALRRLKRRLAGWHAAAPAWRCRRTTTSPATCRGPAARRARRGTAGPLGDGRNDENLPLAQLHVAFLRFHNAAVDWVRANEPERAGDAAVFPRARDLTRWAYQWLCVHDYLAGVTCRRDRRAQCWRRRRPARPGGPHALPAAGVLRGGVPVRPEHGPRRLRLEPRLRPPRRRRRRVAPFGAVPASGALAASGPGAHAARPNWPVGVGPARRPRQPLPRPLRPPDRHAPGAAARARRRRSAPGDAGTRAAPRLAAPHPAARLPARAARPGRRSRPGSASPPLTPAELARAPARGATRWPPAASSSGPRCGSTSSRRPRCAPAARRSAPSAAGSSRHGRRPAAADPTSYLSTTGWTPATASGSRTGRRSGPSPTSCGSPASSEARDPHPPDTPYAERWPRARAARTCYRVPPLAHPVGAARGQQGELTPTLWSQQA